MKTINNLNLANLYNSKILLGTVLSFAGYKATQYIFSSKNEEVNQDTENPVVTENQDQEEENNMVTDFDFGEMINSNNIKISSNHLDLTEEYKNQLLDQLNNIRKVNKDYIDQVIVQRKQLCNISLKEKLGKNEISINGKNRKPNLELIYIDTLTLNDKLNTTLNNIEENIKWLYWFKDDLELENTYDKICYHDKICVTTTLNKLNYNTNELPNLYHYQELKLMTQELINDFNHYKNEINLYLNISKYIVHNNDELSCDQKLVNQVTQIDKIINNQLYYYKINFNDSLSKFNQTLDKCKWIDFNEVEELKQKYSSNHNSKCSFYQFVKNSY